MQNILFSSWGGQIVDNRGNEAQDYDPVTQVQLPEYFQQDEEIKALMGWNGFIIRSEEVDIIDLCQTYLKALHKYSKDCDKCNYCKTGFEELMEVLEDIRNGEATDEDMEFIESASEAIVDSSKCSIGISGPMAFRQACQRAGTVLLEPMMRVEVIAPEENLGDVIGDLNARRGRIESVEPREGLQVVRGQAPMAELFGYATDLRSFTQGRGNYTMQFSHYDEVPKAIGEQVVARVSGIAGR